MAKNQNNNVAPATKKTGAVFEPDDSMIEVAIAAVTPVLPENPEEGKW